jgi:hypothetical protein
LKKLYEPQSFCTKVNCSHVVRSNVSTQLFFSSLGCYMVELVPENGKRNPVAMVKLMG